MTAETEPFATWEDAIRNDPETRAAWDAAIQQLLRDDATNCNPAAEEASA